MIVFFEFRSDVGEVISMFSEHDEDAIPCQCLCHENDTDNLQTEKENSINKTNHNGGGSDKRGILMM